MTISHCSYQNAKPPRPGLDPWFFLFCLVLGLLLWTGQPALAQLADSAEALQGEFEDWAKPIAIAGLVLGIGLIWFGNDEGVGRKIGTGVLIISLLIGAADFVDLLSG